jgi:hypothetical protein
MSAFDDSPYCDDEDVYQEADADWEAIYPRGQVLASGADGTLAADAWVLGSASKDFAAQGVDEGAVVLLEHDGLGATPAALIVDAGGVAPNLLTLRAPGLDSGEGEPPGLVASLADVTFTVTSARYQRRRESEWLARQLNYDDGGGLIAADDLRRPTACRVAARLYRQASRNPDDQFDKLARMHYRESDDLVKELMGRRQSNTETEAIHVVPTDNAYWSPLA